MDADFKKKWLDALRSGEYKQGYGRLRSSDDRFCCLGVLCHVAKVKSEKISYEEAMRLGWGPDAANTYTYDGEPGFLSAPLLEKFGITYDEGWDLAIKNDEGRSFKDTADYIEKNL